MCATEDVRIREPGAAKVREAQAQGPLERLAGMTQRFDPPQPVWGNAGAAYLTGSAPHGGETYTAHNLGLK